MMKMKLSSRGRRAAVVLAAAAALALGLPYAASAHGGMRGPGGAVQSEALAEALGITPEALAEAQAKAAQAALDQAVEAGRLTQDQADALEERAQAWGGAGKAGCAGMHIGGADKDALLAEALGISVEKLREARSAAFEATLKEAEAAGSISAEQAELMRARQKLQDYMLQQGLPEQMRGMHEEALQDAVEAGVITQEQADQLQSGPGFGRGGFGHGGFGRGRMFRFGPGSGDVQQPAPDANTRSGFFFRLPRL